MSKQKFIRQAKLPEGAYKLELPNVLQGFLKQRMKKFQIIRKADDMATGRKVVRISVGGTAKTGYYIVYRGSKDEVKEVLLDAWKAMAALSQELPVSDDGGKKYA